MKTEILPLVSVVVPSYNHAKYINECISSIISQSYRRLELIVIDDGSKDTSVEVIEALVPDCLSRFERFEFIKRENRGLVATLNQAISWCRGDFYSAIASDDFLLQGKIEEQVSYLLNNPEDVAIFGGAKIVDEIGAVTRIYKPSPKRFSFLDLFLIRSSVIAATGMVRMQAIRAIGNIPSEICIEDWYTWLKLTESGASVSVSNSCYVGYRRHASNFSGNLAVMAHERSKVLNFFSAHPCFDLANAHSYLLSAAEFWCTDRRKSLGWLRRAVLSDIRVLLSKRFVMHLGRMLVPARLRWSRW